MSCMICQCNQHERIFHLPRVSACANVPTDPAKIDEEVVGELVVVRCKNCGHIYNQAFDQTVIDRIYALGYSSGLPRSTAVLERYRNVISNAMGTDVVRGATVLEIG